MLIHSFAYFPKGIVIVSAHFELFVIKDINSFSPVFFTDFFLLVCYLSFNFIYVFVCGF